MAAALRGSGHNLRIWPIPRAKCRRLPRLLGCLIDVDDMRQHLVVDRDQRERLTSAIALLFKRPEDVERITRVSSIDNAQ